MPNGVLEEETVATITRLVWRKKNLPDYEITQIARLMAERLQYDLKRAREADRAISPSKPEEPSIAQELKDMLKEAEAEEKKKNKDLKELDLRKMATLDGLMKELDVEERLDAMIDKCLKRLLYLRGLKSLAPATESASLPPAQRRLR